MSREPRLERAFGISLVLSLCLALGCAGPPAPKPPRDSKGGGGVEQSHESLALSRKIQRYAVIVGISDYKHSPAIRDLQFAARDAKAFYDFLRSPAGGGFPKANVKLLLDRDATITNVRSAITHFLAAPVEDDLVLIYFGGHGAPDPKNRNNLYLLCHDTQPDQFGGTALPMREIDLALTYNVKSKRVVVLTDTCHAAGIGAGAGREGEASREAAERINEYWKKLAESRTGITKVAASEADQISQENVRWGGGHGVFTHYLLEALRGQADGAVDGKRDGFVTIAEAFEFLRNRVRRETRNAQCPWASPYKDNSIPLGIVDPSVQKQVEVRQREEERQTDVEPPPVITDIQVPVDSEKAIELAMSYIKRDDKDKARQIVEVVLGRRDKAEPHALAMKIDFLLQDKDLDKAEETYLWLNVNHAQSDKTRVAARLLYDYYRNQLVDQKIPEQMKILALFRKRNPDSPHAKEAEDMQKELEGKLRSDYDQMVASHVGMSDQRAKRGEFDKARAELDQASAALEEALRDHGLRLASKTIDDARLRLLQAERQAAHDAAFDLVKAEAAKADLLNAVLLWDRFVQSAQDNPHIAEAQKTLAERKQLLTQELQAKLDSSVRTLEAAMPAKKFPDAEKALIAARQALSDAGQVKVVALTGSDRVAPLERQFNEAMARDQDYRLFASFEARAAKGPPAERLKIWQEFRFFRRMSTFCLT